MISDQDEQPVNTADAAAEVSVDDTADEVVSTTSTTAAPTSTTTTTAQEIEAAAFTEVTDRELASAITELEKAEVVDSFGDAPDYDRSSYTGDSWGDSDGDCQSDRHEILIEESLIEPVLTDDGCQVASGFWIDAYDGTEYTDARLVTIDHVIPLAAAHRAGAWMWDDESRRAFASDISFPATHVVVGAEMNQSKADSGPDQWRPPNEEAWCRYAVDWISVKDRWSLAFTQTETTALEEMLDTCEPVTAINALAVPSVTDANPITTTISTTTTSTTTAAAPTRNCQGYDPCIEPGPDVDCSGGSGNGPRYSGRVRVTGSDPYGLDHDNNGWGCES